MLRPLSRRTVLRGMFGGAAISMGLPIFEAMLNSNGTAYASGAALPVRFGSWFWGTGIFPNLWIPTTTGANYTAPTLLQPLASMQRQFTVVTNTTVPFTGGFFHWMGQGQMLSGSYDGAGQPFGLPGGVSFDQLVAQQWAGKTAIPSIQVGIAQKAFGDNDVPDVSWLGDKQPNSVEFSPAAFWNSLFGSYHKNEALSQARISALDLVKQDLADLRSRLGAADANRLDQHTQTVRDIENSLQVYLTNTCPAPAQVTDPAAAEGESEPLTERNKLFTDMIALALSCDLTRVFSIQFTGVASNVVFTQAGANDGHHNLSHNGSATAQTMVQNGMVYTMQNLAYMLQKFAATPDGSGTLLDNSITLATSDIGDGSTGGGTHTQNEYPVLLIGGAGGKMVQGLHYRPASTVNAQQAQVTIAKALGLPIKSFGSANSPWTDLLK